MPLSQTTNERAELTAALQYQLTDVIDRAWSSDSAEDYLRSLAAGIGSSVDFFQEIGRAADAELFAAEPHAAAYFVIYEWMESAKAFLLLLRDVEFEAHKGTIRASEGLLDPTVLRQLRRRSRQAVDEALSELLAPLRQGARPVAGLEEKIKKWSKEISPWAVYSLQFKEIGEQATDILEQAVSLVNAGEQYAKIRAAFRESFTGYTAHLEALEAPVTEALGELSDAESVNVIAVMRKLESRLQKEPPPLTATEFIEETERLTNRLPGNQQLLIDTHGGMLLQREANLRKHTTNWLESEAMAAIQDFYSLREQVQNRLQIAIRTSRNRIEFDKQEERTLAKEQIPRTLQQLVKHLERTKNSIGDIAAGILPKLDGELRISNAFQANFLRLDVQQSLAQYRKYQQTGWQELTRWVSSKTKALLRVSQETLGDENLGVSEKIVRIVRERQPAAGNDHYTNMFITDGYIGESFQVGRADEIERVGRIVDDWRLGFRGAVLVTGKRLSGKSFFGEYIGHRYFPNRVLDLRPNTRLDLDGRYLDATSDLREVLEFIIKHSQGKSLCIWIDDLGNWRGGDHPLAQNVKALMEIIDYHSGRLFFVVAIDSALKGHLANYYGIGRYFQAEFNMDRMPYEEVRQAILVRHHATQVPLVNEAGETLEEGRIDQLIGPVYKAAKGRIGDALQRWASDVTFRNEESVHLKKHQSYPFPDLLSDDAGILLRTLLLDGLSREDQLRKRFGPTFKEKFRPLLQRFLFLGIVKREANGGLELNPFIVSDLERLLERHRFINVDLHHQKNPV